MKVHYVGYTTSGTLRRGTLRRVHCQVHYVRYSDEYYEWKEAAEIVHNVDLAETDGGGVHQMEMFRSLDLHR